MSTEKISVKLLTDKKTRRVLFAEAGKDFVDFLFSLLAMPLGTVVELLAKQSMVGSIAELYESVQNLSDMYMQSGQDKGTLLQPKTSFPSTCTNILMLKNSTLPTLNYYRCSNAHSYISTVYGSICPSCKGSMTSQVTLVAPPTASTATNQGDGKGGYVKDVVTYMITDDLVVSPMSTISGLTLLNKLAIKDISILEEKVVAVGMDEGLKLLKASLESKTALTDAFLGTQRYLEAEDEA